MHSHIVDCTGIDPVILLKNLWESAKESPLTIQFQSVGLPKCTKPKKNSILGLKWFSKTNILEMAGRMIYIDFRCYPYIDPSIYNKYNGDNLFQQIFSRLKCNH